jgi:hypothetical protein
MSITAGQTRRLVKPAVAAEVLCTTVASLSQDRYLNRGAPYVRIGKRVLYDLDAVDKYINEGIVTPDRVVAAGADRRVYTTVARD